MSNLRWTHPRIGGSIQEGRGGWRGPQTLALRVPTHLAAPLLLGPQHLLVHRNSVFLQTHQLQAKKSNEQTYVYFHMILGNAFIQTEVFTQHLAA